MKHDLNNLKQQWKAFKWYLWFHGISILDIVLASTAAALLMYLLAYNS